MENKKEKYTIGPHWFGYLSLSCSLLNMCHHYLHTKVWAIYALPIVYIVFVALCIVLMVLYLKNKLFKYLWFPALMIILGVIFANEAFGCVKDITGGTKTVKTAYYRIYSDEIRWFGDAGEEDITLKLDKKFSEEVKGHCTYDKSETKSVYDGVIEVFSCTEIAEITYYPNSKTVTEIKFSPKNG